MTYQNLYHRMLLCNGVAQIRSLAYSETELSSGLTKSIPIPVGKLEPSGPVNSVVATDLPSIRSKTSFMADTSPLSALATYASVTLRNLIASSCISTRLSVSAANLLILLEWVLPRFTSELRSAASLFRSSLSIVLQLP